MDPGSINFEFASLNNKKWNPVNTETWKVIDLKDTFDNLKVLDGIYQSTEKKIDRVIKQRRLMALQGKDHKKTLAEERIEFIEEKVNKQQHDDKDFLKLTNVTDVNNKAMLSDPRLANNEKLKGRFSVIINNTLPMQK